jgi:hypothetical protein
MNGGGETKNVAKWVINKLQPFMNSKGVYQDPNKNNDQSMSMVDGSRILPSNILDSDEEEEEETKYKFVEIKENRINSDISPILPKSANSFLVSSTSLISNLSPRHSGYLKSNFSMKSWKEV